MSEPLLDLFLLAVTVAGLVLSWLVAKYVPSRIRGMMSLAGATVFIVFAIADPAKKFWYLFLFTLVFGNGLRYLRMRPGTAFVPSKNRRIIALVAAAVALALAIIFPVQRFWFVILFALTIGIALQNLLGVSQS